MRTGRILVLVLIATGLAIALSAISAAAEAPGLEAGGEDRVQLFASVSSSADLMRSGNTVVFRVRVVDQFGAVVEGATVSSRAEEGSLTPPEATTDGNGFARFTFTMTTPGPKEVSV